MGKIDYKAIYAKNKHDWYAMTEEPQKYELLLAGHYSDSNHFVYELLQNAEDEKADRAVIEYYSDKLIFYHNGEPFNEEDVQGVSSMLMGTKNKEDAQTIGRFGMGFKSVYKYTHQPEVYSDDEAFRIENYLLPVEIEEGWDCRQAKRCLSYPVSSGDKFFPFIHAEHLTKFMIPFTKQKNNGEILSISGKDVLQKLKELPPEILLFLNHIKKLYWISPQDLQFAMITLDVDDMDKNLISCRIEGSAYGKKAEISRYLKFQKKFDHLQMRGAEVSIAYHVNNRVTNVIDIRNSDIWVYFPTRDHTKLPFMIHGSFETAVSREKLMMPSDFNSYLFGKMGDLICESMLELRQRRLITQAFLRRILLVAFKDETENQTILGLRDKMNSTFRENALLPDKDGDYYKPYEIKVAVPFALADLLAKKGFVAFNNEKDLNFTEYFNWLKDELEVELFTLEDWAKAIRKNQGQHVDIKEKDMCKIKDIYELLSDYRESLYTEKSSFNRSGSYEQTIRSFIPKVWKDLRQAPLIVNAERKLVSAYSGEVPCVYLSSSSEYKNMEPSFVVETELAKKFMTLLKDGFQIKDFDNFQYVKEKVIKKYTKAEEEPEFENADEYENEYVEDIIRIIHLFDSNGDVAVVRRLLADSFIIKVKTEDDTVLFSKPELVYIDISDEGMNLNIYYQSVEDNTNKNVKPEYHNALGYYPLDIDFYHKHEIDVRKLKTFGLITSPVHDGRRGSNGGPGYESWRALEDYCPRLEVEYLEENLFYIECHSDTELAKRKSIEIFKMLIAIRRKLSGKIVHRKTNPYYTEGDCRPFCDLKEKYAWVYDKNEKNQKICEMSKYDLNIDYYGKLLQDKTIYESLGFIEKQEDITADAFEIVDNLDTRNQKILLKQLAKRFGMELQEANHDDETKMEDSQVFQAEEWKSTDFPVSYVQNMDGLVEHVRQQFICADPVTYEKVLRQIRTSKSQKNVRAYAIGMYTNDNSIRICQMCKNPVQTIDVTEIANYGIELPQLNLCLCSNCSRRYKLLRGSHKEKFRDEIKRAIQELDISTRGDTYEIGLDVESSISFTQTHVAELQAIFDLLNRYGEPKRNVSEEVFERNLTENKSALFDERGKDNLDDFNSVKITDAGTEVNHKLYGYGVVIESSYGQIHIQFDNGNRRIFDLKSCMKNGLIQLRRTK